jgi:hypothetical protein
MIHPCQRQVYSAINLHAHPHFSISPNDVGLFRKHCITVLDDESNLVEYSASKSYESDSFLKVWNDCTPEWSLVEPYYEGLKLSQVSS